MPVISSRNDGSFVSSGKIWEAAFDAPETGRFSFQLDKNLKLTSIPAVIDGLEESTALPDRRKLHHSNDGTEAQFDMSGTIPFGQEPAIAHKFKLSEGLLSITTDFTIRPSFAVRRLFAGGYRIEGSIARFALISEPENGVLLPSPEWKDFAGIADQTVLYNAACPPVSLLLETIEGSILELSTGEDFWRWTTSIPNTKALYTILRTAAGLEFTWIPYESNPPQGEEPPPGRNRRMNSMIAWRKNTKSRKKMAFKDTFDMASFDWPDSCLAADAEGKPVKGAPCFAAAGVTNILKKWLRRHLPQTEEGDIFAITSINPVFCHAAAHQDRAKQRILPHLDLYGINEFQLWANRQLIRKGAKLVILAAKGVELPSVTH